MAGKIIPRVPVGVDAKGNLVLLPIQEPRLREDGFYWVEVGPAEWAVAQFVEGEWGFPGLSEHLSDDSFGSISDEPLIPPNKCQHCRLPVLE